MMNSSQERSSSSNRPPPWQQFSGLDIKKQETVYTTMWNQLIFQDRTIQQMIEALKKDQSAVDRLQLIRQEEENKRLKVYIQSLQKQKKSQENNVSIQKANIDTALDADAAIAAEQARFQKLDQEKQQLKLDNKRLEKQNEQFKQQIQSLEQQLQQIRIQSKSQDEGLQSRRGQIRNNEHLSDKLQNEQYFEAANQELMDPFQFIQSQIKSINFCETATWEKFNTFTQAQRETLYNQMRLQIFLHNQLIDQILRSEKNERKIDRLQLTQILSENKRLQDNINDLNPQCKEFQNYNPNKWQAQEQLNIQNKKTYQCPPIWEQFLQLDSQSQEKHYSTMINQINSKFPTFESFYIQRTDSSKLSQLLHIRLEEQNQDLRERLVNLKQEQLQSLDSNSPSFKNGIIVQQTNIAQQSRQYLNKSLDNKKPNETNSSQTSNKSNKPPQWNQFSALDRKRQELIYSTMCQQIFHSEQTTQKLVEAQKIDHTLLMRFVQENKSLKQKLSQSQIHTDRMKSQERQERSPDFACQNQKDDQKKQIEDMMKRFVQQKQNQSVRDKSAEQKNRLLNKSRG